VVDATQTASKAAARITVISADANPNQGTADLIAGLRLYPLWSRLALHEVRQRFRRSLLGPLWLTLSMGIWVAAMGFVFSALFHQNAGQTLPYIAIGVIFWSLLTSSINEGTSVFIGNEGFIRNVPLPLSVHVFRMLARNLIIWAFNMVIYVAVLVFFGILPNANLFWFFPGFALFMINAAWMALAAAILSTRFRDIPQVIANVIQVVFFLTPVFWSLESLPNRPAFVVFNPFYHLLEVVRAPLLGQAPAVSSWGFDIGLAVVGVAATLLLYRRAFARIAYWV